MSRKANNVEKKCIGQMRDRILIGLVGIIFVLLCVLVWIKPDEEYSISERRLLKQMPEFSKESVLSGRFMSVFEEYSLDQFPFRNALRGLKAMTSLKLDNNGIYVVDEVRNGETGKVICDMDYPLDEDSLLYVSKRFGDVYDMYLEDGNCQVYLTIVPDKNYFYGENNGYLSMDYKQLVDIMLTCGEDITYIDIFPYLSGEDYYRTDIHWKQENITDVANVLLDGMGQETIQQSQYKTVEVNGNFCGVYYGQAALPIEPDRIQYVTDDVIEGLQVYDYQNNREIPVYDKEKINDKDPYEMYVGGPISLATIDNPTCKNERQLIIFRDSFGSSIAPLLAQGYSKTTLIDIRYILPSLLGQYVDFKNADILFLYSTPVLNHSETLK